MNKMYYPCPCHDGKHKYYIITKSGKIIKFGAVGCQWRAGRSIIDFCVLIA